MRENQFAKELSEKYPAIMSNVYCGVSCPPGWQSLVRTLVEDLDSLGVGVQCTQIKEKFGGLCFYTGPITHAQQRQVRIAEALIRKAEGDSYSICDVCGEHGWKRNTGWIRTLCTTHHEQREAGTL